MRALRLFLIIVLMLGAASAYGRVWTETSGKQTQGNFVRYFNGDVVIMRGKQVIKIPFDSLSTEDQDFVRKLLEAKGKGDLLPPPRAKDDGSTDGRLATLGEERTWTRDDGKEIQAQLVGVSGEKVILLYQGKEITYPLSRLSEADRQYVKEEQTRQRKKAAPAVTPQQPAVTPQQPGWTPPPIWTPPPVWTPPANPTPQPTPQPMPQPTPTPMPIGGGPPMPAPTPPYRPAASPLFTPPPIFDNPPHRLNDRRVGQRRFSRGSSTSADLRSDRSSGWWFGRYSAAPDFVGHGLADQQHCRQPIHSPARLRLGRGDLFRHFDHQLCRQHHFDGDPPECATDPMAILAVVLVEPCGGIRTCRSGGFFLAANVDLDGDRDRGAASHRGIHNPVRGAFYDRGRAGRHAIVYALTRPENEMPQ